MNKPILTLLCALALATLAQGCAGVPYQTYDLVDDIAEDQQALNDAYGRALNGQILLNVLRSRDRWPRHYTNVSPITDQPTVQTSGSLELSPLGLGSVASPFAGSNATVSHEESTRPSYGVQPLDSEAINRAVLSRTERSVFANYWDNGWPRDVLLFTMVSGISRSVQPAAAEGDERRSAVWGPTLANTARGLTGDCQEAGAPTGTAGARTAWDADPNGANSATSGPRPECAFFQLVHRLANLQHNEIRLRAAPDPVCRDSRRVDVSAANADLIAGLASLSEIAGNKLSVSLPRTESNAQRAARLAREAALRRQNRPVPDAGVEYITLRACQNDEHPAAMIEVLGEMERNADGDNEPKVIATYLLDMRSLDAMVFAMGEVLRRDNGGGGVLRGPCEVGEASCPLVPMFRVVPGPIDRDEDFAAVVVHRGDRYFAGPAVQTFGPTSASVDGDRTATVLTLLTQLFALNNSPSALLPIPARPVID